MHANGSSVPHTTFVFDMYVPSGIRWILTNSSNNPHTQTNQSWQNYILHNAKSNQRKRSKKLEVSSRTPLHHFLPQRTHESQLEFDFLLLLLLLVAAIPARCVRQFEWNNGMKHFQIIERVPFNLGNSIIRLHNWWRTDTVKAGKQSTRATISSCVQSSLVAQLCPPFERTQFASS